MVGRCDEETGGVMILIPEDIDYLKKDFKTLSEIFPARSLVFEDFIKRYLQLEDDLGISGQDLKIEFLKKEIAGLNLFWDDWKFDFEMVVENLNSILGKYNLDIKIKRIEYLENYEGEIEGTLGKTEFFLRYYDLNCIFYYFNKILTENGLIIVSVDTGADAYEFTILKVIEFEKVMNAFGPKIFLDPVEMLTPSDRQGYDKFFKMRK